MERVHIPWIHSLECTRVTLVCYGIMYLGKYLFCGKLNLWHTLGIAAQHTLVQASRTDTTSRCSHVYHDPTCLTWRAIALRCTVNSLHSWYKLPSTLTTYHTAYLFSFTLPWYVAYSRPRILAQLQLRRERVKIYLYNRVATENSHVQFYDVTSWNYVNKDDPVLFARGNGLYISVY